MLATLFLYIAMGVSPAHEGRVEPLDEYMDLIDNCYDRRTSRALRRPRDLVGDIELWFVVDPNGVVDSVQNITTNIEDERLVRCVVKTVKVNPFLAPHRGGIFLFNEDDTIKLTLSEDTLATWGDESINPHRAGTVHVRFCGVLSRSRGRKGRPERVDPGSERIVYTVKVGDTLSSLADRYGVLTRDLRDWNGKEGDRLLVGEEIIVWVAPIQGCAREERAARIQPKRPLWSYDADVERFVFTTVPGDTLADIAPRHGVLIEDLAEWNGVAEDAVFYDGEEIIIWIRGATPFVTPR